MQGDIVKAAKWLGGSLVLSTCVAVVGFHPTVTGRVLTIQKVRSPSDRTDSMLNQSETFGPPGQFQRDITPERIHGGVMLAPPPMVSAPAFIPPADPVAALPTR